MSDESASVVRETSCSYECNGCGERFESVERLRQHEVDCTNDDFDWIA